MSLASWKWQQVSCTDMQGQRFGKLEVIDKFGRENRRMYWVCVCECGSLCVASGYALRAGETKSCGCLNRARASEHITALNHSRKGKPQGKALRPTGEDPMDYFMKGTK